MKTIIKLPSKIIYFAGFSLMVTGFLVMVAGNKLREFAEDKSKAK